MARNYLRRSNAGDLYLDEAANLLHQATITLTHAQIKALPTTPVQIVVAPGAGAVVLLVAAMLRSNFAVAYTNVAGTFTLATDKAEGSQRAGWSALGTANSTTRQVRLWAGASFGSIDDSGGFEPDAVAIENKALEFYVDGGSGDYTAGDAANTLTVSATYLLVNAAGEFE